MFQIIINREISISTLKIIAGKESIITRGNFLLSNDTLFCSVLQRVTNLRKIRIKSWDEHI